MSHHVTLLLIGKMLEKRGGIEPLWLNKKQEFWIPDTDDTSAGKSQFLQIYRRGRGFSPQMQFVFPCYCLNKIP